MRNLLREKLLKGKPTLGCWVTIPHPEIPEILSLLEFDWFLFDMEHAPITVTSLGGSTPSYTPKDNTDSEGSSKRFSVYKAGTRLGSAWCNDSNGE